MLPQHPKFNSVVFLQFIVLYTYKIISKELLIVGFNTPVSIEVSKVQHLHLLNQETRISNKKDQCYIIANFRYICNKVAW